MVDKTSDPRTAWDNSTEYAGLATPDITADLDRVSELLARLHDRSGELGEGLLHSPAPIDRWRALIPVAHELYRLVDEADRLLSNLAVFAECEASLDSKNSLARSLGTDLQARAAKLAELSAPLRHFSLRLPEELLTEYLGDSQVRESEFKIRFGRARVADTLLPLREEQLLDILDVNGTTAWGNLYTNIAGTARTQIVLNGSPREATLATLSGLLQSPDAETRHVAYRGTQEIWALHEEAAAAGLNALSGWRLDVCKRRSHTRVIDFLDGPLVANRITPKTLDVLLEVTRESRGIGQRALTLMARSRGALHLHPADLFAPPPERILHGEGESITFDRALAIITAAFDSVDRSMGDFVRTMHTKGWIEARELPSKRPGAYCTGFAKSRTPRVYMTYMNGMRDAKVLAHELGHALHEWVMRDLPRAQTDYPMTVAETASNFAEMVVGDYLAREATNPRDTLYGAWQSVQDGIAYTINIPARFEFEREFYRQRAARTFMPDQLSTLMEATLRAWYGDTLAEFDRRFWASKMHFHIASLSFYNFPYLFGYLFSLGVYAQRVALGTDFYPAYVRLLRDTGRLSIEELAHKHLGVDLEAPGFWRQSFAIFQRQVDALERAIAV